MVETGQYLPAKLLFETLSELDYHLVPEKSARITVRLQPRASRDEVLKMYRAKQEVVTKRSSCVYG
jgi:hypothetical protein